MSDADKQILTKELDEKARNKIEKSVDNFNQKLENKLKKEKIRLEKEYNKKNMDIDIVYKRKALAEYTSEKMSYLKVANKDYKNLQIHQNTINLFLICFLKLWNY